MPTDRTKTGPRVVVVTSDGTIKKPILRALASMGWEVSHCDLKRESLALQVAEPREMYIVDADGSHEDIRWFLPNLYELHPDTIVIVVAQDFTNALLYDAVQNQNINNLIAKHGAMSAFKTVVNEHELIATCYKLYYGDIFGLEKYLSSLGLHVRERQLHFAEEKKIALQDLSEFLRQIDCSGALNSLIMTVGDELLMNAIFSAPRDNQGGPKYETLDRKVSFALGPTETVGFRYACDGRTLALSVVDQFGSLAREIILKYLRPRLTGEQAEIEHKLGGAGLGLHMVYSSINQLIFNIHPGIKTEVIALFYIRSGMRSFKESGRSLNIFLNG